MAELPEIAKLSGQMRKVLQKKQINKVTILQEKCANVSEGEFQKRVGRSKVIDVYYKGKWIITKLNNGENILLSLGMGADVLYFTEDQQLPEKYQVIVQFIYGSGFTIRFWWFGKFLLVSDSELANEPNTKAIAIDPFDERFTHEHLVALLKGKKTQIKSFLLDQKNVGGIGNMYMHDILYKSGLHPQRKISSMSDNDIKALYQGIRAVLDLSREKGTFSYENDFFGQKGGYGIEDFLIGYKENTSCPVCGEEIQLIKTGSTKTYICPNCQKLD